MLMQMHISLHLHRYITGHQGQIGHAFVDRHFIVDAAHVNQAIVTNYRHLWTDDLVDFLSARYLGAGLIGQLCKFKNRKSSMKMSRQRWLTLSELT